MKIRRTRNVSNSWWHRHGKKGTAAIAVASLVIAGLTVAVQPAAAANPEPADVSALLAGLQQFATFSEGFATQGLLGKPLPFVSLAPGSTSGLAYASEGSNEGLLQAAVVDTLQAQAGGLSDLTAASPYSLSLPNGTTGTLTVASTGTAPTDTLQLTLDVTRVVKDQPLDISGTLSGSTQPVTLSSGHGVDVTLHSKMTFDASVVPIGGSKYYFYIGSDSFGPSATFDFTSKINSPSKVDAAIGLLGASLSSATFVSTENLTLSMSDPTGSGQLSFTTNTGAKGPLAQSGAVAGLTHVGFASPAGSVSDGAGHPAALTIAPTALSGQSPLQSTTVDVSWPDVSTDSAVLTNPDGGLAPLGDFLNMSAKDLIDGLAHLSTTVDAIQRSQWGTDASNPMGNQNIRFMKGTLADAADASGALRQFVTDYSYGPNNPVAAFQVPGHDPSSTAPPDPKLGLPTFNSIQGLLADFAVYDPAAATPPPTDLQLPGDARIAVGAVHFNDSTSGPDKLLIPLTITRAPKEQPFNSVAATAEQCGSSGTVQQNKPDPQFGELQFGNAFNQYGIARANACSTTATVTPSYTLNLGLVLNLQAPITGSHCGDASTLAEFPQYKAGITSAGGACPFQQVNPDGSTVTVASLPTNPDRTELRTGSVAGLSGDFLDADFPITSKAPDNFAAQVGYLEVHLAGTLKLTGPASGHMRTINLISQSASDGTTDQTLDQVAQLLATTATSTSSNLLTETSSATASGQFSVDVPDSAGSTSTKPGFFGESADCQGGGSPALPCVTISGDLTGSAPTITGDDTLLNQLKAFNFDTTSDTSTALATPLVKTLTVLDNSLAGGPGDSSLSKSLPMLGRTLSSLVAAQDSGSGPNVTFTADSLTDTTRPFDSTNDPNLDFVAAAAPSSGNPSGTLGNARTMTVGTEQMVIKSVTAGASGGTTFTFTQDFGTQPKTGTPYALNSALKDALVALAASSPNSLQDFLAQLTTVLGSGSTATIGIDTSTTPASLVVKLDWKRTAHSESTLSVPVSTCNGSPCSLDLVASPDAKPILATTSGDYNLGLLVPLQTGTGPATPSDVKLAAGSTATGDVTIADTDPSNPAGTIGPLSVALGSNSGGGDHIAINGDYEVGLSDGTSAQKLDAFLNNSSSSGLTVGSKGVTCNGSASDALCGYIPAYAGSTNDGPITVDVAAATPTTFPKGATTANAGLAGAAGQVPINVSGITAGIDKYFETVQNGLNTASFDGKIPFIGKDLQQGADFVGKLRQQFDSSVNDFVNNLLSNVPNPTADDLTTGLTNKLQPALRTIDPAATAPVQAACTVSLQPVGGLKVATTPNPATDTSTSWSYAVAGHTAYNGTTYVSEYLNEAITVKNAGTLDTTNYNSISWTTDPSYSGYYVLRSKNGGPWVQIDDTTTGSYTDQNSGGTPPAAPNANPGSITYKLGDCPPTTSILFVTQIQATIDVKGSVNAPNMPFSIGIPGLSLSSKASSMTAGVAWELKLQFGVSKDSGFYVVADGKNSIVTLSAQVTPPPTLAGQIAIFNLDLKDHDTSRNTDCLDSTQKVGSQACLTGYVDLKSASGLITASDLANPGALADDIQAGVHGNIDIDWDLSATVGAQNALPGITGEFKLGWDFHLCNVANPTQDAQCTSAGLNAGDLNVEFDNIAVDAGTFLSGVFGKILQEVKSVTDPLEPVISTLTAPIPVLSDLSHAAGGGDVTLLTIAEAFNTLAGGPDLTMINRLVKLIDLVNHIANLVKCDDPNTPNSCKLILGSYVIAGSGTHGADGSAGDNSQSLLDNPVNPDAAADPSTIGTITPGKDANLEDSLQSTTKIGGALPSSSGTGTKPGDNSGVSLNDKCQPPAPDSSSPESEQAGLSFPLLQHPLNIFRLLLGQDIALACFDSGILSIGFSYSQAFGPVYAPPPVLITISGSASASLHIVGGFDTYGIRKAIEGGASQTTGGKVLDVLSSLFFTTTDQSGNPIPVVTLTGSLAAGAEVSVLIVSVGVEGGISLTINFTWRDPDNDGKFRFDEFLTTALNNPLCLFNVSGELDLFLKVNISIGFGPFGISFSITLVNIKLLDFSISADCTPPPPVLGADDTSSGTLVVFMGALGTGANRGDSAWDNKAPGGGDENFTITQYDNADGSQGPSGFAIDGMGVHDVFPYDSNHPITRVFVDAQGYKGNETVTMVGALDPQSVSGNTAPKAGKLPFTADAVVYGGDGNDTITTGAGNSYVTEGSGTSSVTTHDASGKTVWIGSNAGALTAHVGDGDDVIVGGTPLGNAGGSSICVTTSGCNSPWVFPAGDNNPPSTIAATPGWAGNPTLPSVSDRAAGGAVGGAFQAYVGHGKDEVWGSGGGSTINVAPDNATGGLVSKGFLLVGGQGANQISAGGSAAADPGATFTVFAGQYQDPGGSPATTWTGVSGDHFDNVTLGSPNTTVYAGSYGTAVHGGSVQKGAGSPAAPSTTSDTIYGGAGNDTLFGGSGDDTIYGGGGDNVIIGGTGNNHLYGGSGNDYIVAGGGSVAVNDLNTPGTQCGASGAPNWACDVSIVPDRSVTPTAVTAVDGHNVIAGGGGSNKIWGGNGGDTIYGHYTDETCTAAASNDHPYAVSYNEDTTAGFTGTSPFTGTVPVEQGTADWIYGGTGDDVISGGGGTNNIDSGAGNDVACGGTGNDTIVGHSSTTQVDKFYGIAGSNTIIGGSGNDQLIGGSGDDTVFAGSGNAYLEGGDGYNNLYAGGGNDAIIGGNSSPGLRHNAPSPAADPADGRTGGTFYGGTGVAAMIGDNGCADMTAEGPVVSFPVTASNPITINSCFPTKYGPAPAGDQSPNLHVFDLDSGKSTLSEDNVLLGAAGPSMMFGGLGSNIIVGGSADNYIEGGTGPNYILGGTGNNDIIGGSSPSYLPLGTCSGGSNAPVTSCIPAGSNIIYGDDGLGGTTCGCMDGSNAIIADNGQITRAGVFPGWQRDALLSNPIVWGDGSTVPNRTITDMDIYNGDLQGAESWIFAGTNHDFLFGGPKGTHLYGGPPVKLQPIGTPGSQVCPALPARCLDPNAAYGNDYMEGGAGHNFFESAGGQNDMIGGVSPLHLVSGKQTGDVANNGSTMFGGNGDNYEVADNGEIDHECGSAGSPSVAACTSPSTPWASDPNDATTSKVGSYFRSVTLLNLPTTSPAYPGVGGDSELHTGNGNSSAYGGVGNDKLLGGLGENYLMGGPGNNCITGSGGSNDIIGGTAPEVLQAGLTTAVLPSGQNLIYADMLDNARNACLTANPGGDSAGATADGSNVVIGNNGDIVRRHDGNGVWIRSNNDPHDTGIIQRTITNLDIYGYPLPAEPGTKDVVGGGDVIFGGTHDDILLGGPGGNTMYAGPPSPTGSVNDPATGQTFDNTAAYGNNHIEGGPGQNRIYGAGGDDDIIGGVTPLYLKSGTDTGDVGSIDTAPKPQPGNLLVGGTGNDYIAGANAQVDHLCGTDQHVCAAVDPAQWAFNTNDAGGVAGQYGSSVRKIQLLNLTTASGPTGVRTAGIGTDNTIYGTAGDNHLYGENGNNWILGGPGNDYVEGGTGNNLIQGAGGDNDLIGGSSPASIPSQGGVAKDDTYVANRLPSGNNIICAFVCGKKMTPGSTADPLVAGDTSNDTVIVGHNGRIDRCAALVSNGVGTPQGSDSCTWKRTPYGAEKVSSWFSSSAGSGVAQTGQLCSVVVNGCPATDLGSPRTRFTTLLGQSPTETIQAGTDYLEGNIGNNIIYGEDGPAVIHAVTPNQTDPATVPNASTLYPQYAEFGANFTLSSECLPNAAYSAVHNQNILIGGYGGVGVNRNLHDLANGNASNDVLCGGFGDDAILGNRGLVGTQHATSASDPLSGAVTPTPFGNNASGPVTIGVTGGPPYGVLTIPSSGNTIYPVRLDVEYSDGLLVPVPNWNNPTATGQANQHDIIFGGGGNNSIHGSPGADFVIGDSGIHVAGTPVPCAAVPPSSAPPTPCAPTGDNIIFGGGGNDSIEGGAGNADIFGGAANKDIDVRRSDTTTAPKVDNNGVCMPLAFGTISVTPASLGAGNGYCAPNPSFPQYQWANQSYASRFPLPTGSVYDVDTSGRDNGGTASHTTVFGHVTITGLDRTIAQAQGFGDRMIGPNGSYNLYYVCPAAYGGYQIIRAFKPGLLTFMQQLAGMDGAYNVNQTAKPPTTPSSGDYEINFVYPTSGNTGSAYPTTTGHFTC